MSIIDPALLELPQPRTTAKSPNLESLSSPIRLQKFLTTFGFGGTERQVVNLVRNLDRSRFEIRFACMKRWGQFLQDIEQQQIPIDEYRIKRLYMPDTFIQQLRLARKLRQQKIQISHSYNFYANAFAIPAAKLAGVPVIIGSIRDTGMCITPAKMRVNRLICRLAHCVVVNAEAVRQWLIGQNYDPDKIVVIRNGIDFSRFTPSVDSGGLKREFNLPDNASLVVVLARLTPQKGIETFLEAAAAVGHKFPNARFVIVGDMFTKTTRDGLLESDVSYQKTLAQFADRHGLSERVIFTGYRSDVPELLSQASVSVLPSHSGEGLSNSLLESMAAGVPVIATQVGGNAEVIGENAVAGLLVPAKDPKALSQSICRVLENKEFARGLSCEAKKRVSKHFSLERMVRETENLYTTLLERTKHSRVSARRIADP